MVRLLGRGGTGSVYLVRNPLTQKPFAVKVLSPELADREPELVRRFIREAEFAMKERHQNFIEVYDAGCDPETGLYYLIMEYAPAGSLADMLKALGPMKVDDALAIAADVARALEFVESKGLVHRDVKPANVLIAHDGTAKLSDLGISRFRQAGETSATVTEVGNCLGTPAYMAPEQMIDAHAVDTRADVYSFGVVLYEMIAGRCPNAGEPAMRILARAMKGQGLPDLLSVRPDVPRHVAALVNALVRPDPMGRPAHFADVLTFVKHPETMPLAEGPVAWHQDVRLVAAIVALVTALSVLMVTLFFSEGTRRRQAASAGPLEPLDGEIVELAGEEGE